MWRNNAFTVRSFVPRERNTSTVDQFRCFGPRQEQYFSILPPCCNMEEKFLGQKEAVFTEWQSVRSHGTCRALPCIRHYAIATGERECACALALMLAVYITERITKNFFFSDHKKRVWNNAMLYDMVVTNNGAAGSGPSWMSWSDCSTWSRLEDLVQTAGPGPPSLPLAHPSCDR